MVAVGIMSFVPKTMLGANTFDMVSAGASWVKAGLPGISWGGVNYSRVGDAASVEAKPRERMLLTAMGISLLVNTLFMGGFLSSLIVLSLAGSVIVLHDIKEIAEKVRTLYAGSDHGLTNSFRAADGLEERMAVLTTDTVLLKLVPAEGLMTAASTLGMV